MKRFLLTYIILFASVPAMAQATNTVTVSNIEFRRVDTVVNATFEVRVGKKATRSNYSLVMIPMLQHGVDKMEMPPVVVQGKKAAIAADRHEMAKGGNFDTSEATFTRNGETVGYKFSFRYEPWMSGSQFVFDGVSVGCCSATDAGIGLIAENVLPEPPKREVVIYETETETIETRQSTGDKLAITYSFLAPVDDYESARKKAASGDLFDHANPSNVTNQHDIDRYIDENRDGSLTVYFKQGNSTVDPNFRSNYRSLNDLLTAVRMIESSEDSKVVRVVIAGFASPEGTASINDRLAWDRAVAVKNFLLNNSSLKGITVNIHNGSVDWQALRNMVAASDMYDKYSIMDIIDNTPVWNEQGQASRQTRLRNLNGGAAYRHMYEHFFPELRNATYIKIYYENTEP